MRRHQQSVREFRIPHAIDSHRPPARASVRGPYEPRRTWRESWRDRTMLSALTVSALSHITLILVLSLIVYRSGIATLPTELTLAQIDREPVHLETYLASKPEPPRMVAERLAPDLDFSIPIDIVPPLSLETAEWTVDRNAPGSTDHSTVQRQSSLAAERLGIPASQVAISIQERVSAQGGKRGEVQFALAWKNVNDVDLHVIAPSGERISHLHKSSTCGGLLDVDMNVRGESISPVENIRWIANPPVGRYTVLIHLFRIHRPQTGIRVTRGSPFQLLALLGPESHLESDTVSQRRQLAVYRFQYIPSDAFGEQREKLLEQLERSYQKQETAAQPMLEQATRIQDLQSREVALNQLILRFPHTDAAIEAMQMLGGEITKTNL